MLIFLDTEYTDRDRRRLISLGMVTQDGQRTLYMECAEVSREGCSRFVVTHVWPHLGQDPAALCDSVTLQHRLSTWLASLPRQVRLACDSPIDAELLRKALAAPLPSNVSTERYDLGSLINTTVYHQAVCRYHEVSGHPWHHALHDARAHRCGWLAWQDAQRQARSRVGGRRHFLLRK